MAKIEKKKKKQKRQGPGRIFVLGPLSRRNKLKCIQEGLQSILTRSVRLTHFQLTNKLSHRGTNVKYLEKKIRTYNILFSRYKLIYIADNSMLIKKSNYFCPILSPGRSSLHTQISFFSIKKLVQNLFLPINKFSTSLRNVIKQKNGLSQKT